MLGGINLRAPAVTLVCGTVAAVRAVAAGARTTRTEPALAGMTRRVWCHSTLRWFCFWELGIHGVHGFVMHHFFSDFAAEFIGWPNSPFQFEVAYANVVFGVVGAVVLFRPRRDFTLAINAQRYPVDKSRGRATKYDRLDEAW